MNRPALQAVVERRLLVNYRADPDVVAPLLPAPLRPQLVDGVAVVGICLIRLGAVRPRRWPRALGLTSENAAHRIAVEWPTADGPRAGVYIPRRDSDSIANVTVGGRLYPGVHHRAEFRVAETADSFDVRFASRDGSTSVHVEAACTSAFTSRTFDSLDDASAFFRAGAVGLSPGHDHRLEGLELQAERWAVEPVRLVHVRSSFFDDTATFPRGSVELDCGLVMRDVAVTWTPAHMDGASSRGAAGGDRRPLRVGSGRHRVG